MPCSLDRHHKRTGERLTEGVAEPKPLGTGTLRLGRVLRDIGPDGPQDSHADQAAPSGDHAKQHGSDNRTARAESSQQRDSPEDVSHWIQWRPALPGGHDPSCQAGPF